MHETPDQRPLLAALQTELSGAQALRGLLEHEAELLGSMQLTELEALVEAKRNAVAGLQEAAQRRNEAVAALGYAAKAEGVVAFMTEGHPVAELDALWERLKAVTAVCAELNARNERLNRGGQRQFRQLIRLMRGEPAEPLTYDELVRMPGG